MSAARTEPADAPEHFDPKAVELARRLVRLFGIERARKIAFQASSYLNSEYGDTE